MNFFNMIRNLNWAMENEAEIVHPHRWQATDVSQDPSAKMVELLHIDLEARMSYDYLGDYQNEIKPNLPWADDHFLERVCGEPLNPGVEWANWPWATSADTHRESNGQFNHNYMERYWPRYAGMTPKGELDNKGLAPFNEDYNYLPRKGIRHEYGDLRNLVVLLAREPDTRQAYMPIWFPEDTGTAHNGRKPCTLGYHFIMRNNQLDIVYYIRSCDFGKHFRDDVYMTVRLVLWVLAECRKINHEVWGDVKPGDFFMKITSLHMFINDYIKEYGHAPE